MFGLEGDKKRNNQEFVFDLEEDIKTATSGKQIKDDVASRTKEVKGILRGGQDKEHFDEFGVLLHGYTSLQKVIARVSKKR